MDCTSQSASLSINGVSGARGEPAVSPILELGNHAYRRRGLREYIYSQASSIRVSVVWHRSNRFIPRGTIV